MKVNLSNITSGTNTSTINDNFTQIGNALNNGTLWRLNPVGEPNQMQNLLDMNANRIINLPSPISNTDAARLQDVVDAIAGARTATLTQFTPYQYATSTNVQGAIQQVVDKTINTASLILNNVKAFGVVADGITDDTVAMQAAIDSGLQAFWLPAGTTIRITRALNIKSSKFYMYGQKATILLDDPTGLQSSIIIGNQTAQVNQVQLESIVFTRAQVGTLGAAVSIINGGIVDLEDLLIYGNSQIPIGIQFNQAVQCSVKDSYITGTTVSGIDLKGTDANVFRCIDIRIDRNRIEKTATGINCGDYVEGLYVRNNIIFQCSTVGFAYGAGAHGLISVKLQNNDFDTCGIGVYMQSLSAWQISDNWFSNNTSQNILIKDTASTGTITGNLAFGTSAVDSFEIGGKYIQISGNNISGGNHLILLKSTSDSVSISDNSLSNGIYAVSVAENPTNFQINGNNSFGNVSGFIYGLPGGAGGNIQNNRGYNGPGSAFIAVGASPFTYQAGPTTEWININSGTVSEVDIDGVAVAFSSPAGFLLPANKPVKVTYSVTPLMTKVIQ